jgi:replicative DNA helicase
MKWLDENLEEHRAESHTAHREHFFDPAGQGNRSNAAVSILGSLINKKVEKDLSQEILRLWNEQNTPPLPEIELDKIISGFYMRYAKSGNDIPLVYNFKEMAVAYQGHINDLPKRVKLGFPVLDEKIRGIKKGEVMTLIGKTSVGKSAFLQNIAMNFAKYSGEPTLFFSMEMPISSVMERSIQMDMNKSGYEVESVCSETVGIAADMAEIIFNKIPSFYCIEESGLTLERIESIIGYAESNIYHKPTALVVIDYLGLIKSKEKNIYERVSEIARELKNLAKKKKIAVITLSQTTKQNDTTSELSLGSARDSGVIDEASDFVIGLWKDHEQDEFAQFNELQLGILKNRNGFTGTIPIKMNRKNLVFSANDKKMEPSNDEVSMRN